MNTLKNKFKEGFTSFDFKIIATILMIIDHFSAGIIEKGYFNGLNGSKYDSLIKTAFGRRMFDVNYICRLVGRISFPLFAFLIVQGFIHTSNRWKYLRRVFVFALLSEIPFDLLHGNSFFSFGHQNVMFSFVLGLIMLMILEKFDRRYVIQGIMVIGFCYLSVLLKVDYTYTGMLFIAFFYVFRSEVDKTLMFLTTGVLCIYKYSGFFYSGALSLVLINSYNGDKGRDFNKYLFYLIYPLHILLIVFIRYLIMGMWPT